MKFNFAKIKTFFQRLFPFFSKQVPTVVPTNPSPEPSKAPTSPAPVVVATPVATQPDPSTVAPSTQAYMGDNHGGNATAAQIAEYQANANKYTGPVNDIHGLVIENPGEPKWFGPGITKYIMPKVEAGKKYMVSIADANGRVDVKVFYSDATEVPGASFTASNAGAIEFRVDRGDDLTVEVLTDSSRGTIERQNILVG